MVKLRDFGNGHAEAVIYRQQLDAWKALNRSIDRDLPPDPAAPTDPEENRRRAVRRAKQKVRHLAKTMIVNSLWTLTYRSNVQDRSLVLRHLEQFVRRVKRVLGDLTYIAVLERQDRGAYHVHLATHALPQRITQAGVKVKSWDVMRAIWRAVVGELDRLVRSERTEARDRKLGKRIFAAIEAEWTRTQQALTAITGEQQRLAIARALLKKPR